MIRKDIIAVMGDMENFLDRLLAHTQEENCRHSVSDFLEEYFDNKNNNEKRETGSLPNTSTLSNANNNQSKFQQGVSLS